MAVHSNHEKWRQLFVSASEPTSREPTSECPPLPMFCGWHLGGEADRVYGHHIRTCGYCRRQLGIAARVEHKDLFTGLKKWSRGVLKSLTITRSWWDGSSPELTLQPTWDHRMQDFGDKVADELRELLSHACGNVGVASGETLHWAVTGMAALPKGPPRPDALTCVSTVGDLVYGLRRELKADIHSSTLAMRLSGILNGRDDVPCLTMPRVWAFIPRSEVVEDGQDGHKEVVPIPPWAAERDRSTLRATDPNYRAIFGGQDVEKPAITNLSAILTCCGGPEQPNKHLSARLYRLGGVTTAEMLRLTDGDIGEALLRKKDLSDNEKLEFGRIMNHWTCITEEHYRHCAANAVETDNPGVVMVAIGSNKLRTVCETIRRKEGSLVNHLFIDVDLANALAKELVSPTVTASTAPKHTATPRPNS